MQLITVKQFLALGHKAWREIHWTRFGYMPEYEGTAYQMTYEPGGNVFAVWVV